jgi:acyl dehydratase
MPDTALQTHFAEGRDLGASDWLALPQALLTDFEVLTLSNDPLHTDPAWVRRHTRYADTIAPGFLTMSLLPYLAAQVALVPAGYVGVNYGFDRLRWPAPVPVRSEVQARFVARGARPLPGGEPGAVAQVEVTVQARGQARPGLVAQWLVAVMPDPAAAGAKG